MSTDPAVQAAIKAKHPTYPGVAPCTHCRAAVEAARPVWEAPIRALHSAGESSFCYGCGFAWPCPTLKALDARAAVRTEPEQ
jgi:hypothetical protein